MDKKPFLLQVGAVSFNKGSISYILFGFFLLGILMGFESMFFIEHPEIPLSITMLFLGAAIIPLAIIIKGVKKAEIIK